MPKKLCLILPEYRLETETHFNYLYDLIKNLQEETDIFLIVEKGSHPDFFKNGNIYVQKFNFLPMRALENLLAIKYARLRGYRDFYVHYSFLSAFNASFITKITGGRTFYWNCGLPWLYRRNFLRDKFERLVYMSVTFLVTGTDGLKREYSKYYGVPLAKIKTFPNWIDIKRIESGKNKIKADELKKDLEIPPGAKVLLFAHRLSRRKGAHHLPEILNELRDENIILVIVGDGPEKENIQLQITNFRLQDRVRFLGWIPQNEIMKYFVMADIFLLPSEEEGFPHVLLEAMAVGVPFAAFDVGGVREIIPPELRSYLAEDGDLKNLIRRIKELLDIDREKSDILRRSEAEWVKKFDIKYATERFKNLFL